LIAALVLASAAAQAGLSRNLTMAANDPPVVDAASKATETKAEEPKPEPAKPVAGKSVETPKVEKPKRRRMSTEARVIYELHRHGIYW
jgi:hypothetical protein